jgi:hypothetical protein
MGPLIPRRRKLVRKKDDGLGVPPPDDAQSPGPGQLAPESRGPDAGRKPPSGGVTHRSPSPDDMLLPCCGRALSEVPGRDQVTTDPAQVTCHG